MYDQIFSIMWFIENKESVYKFILIASTILAAIIFLKIFRLKKLQTIPKIIILILLTTISLIIVFFPAEIFFEILESQQWDPVNRGHTQHALIKEYKNKNGKYPATQEDVQNLDRKNYDKINTRAKTAYIYDSTSDQFTFFIRYKEDVVLIFDSKNEFAFYNIDKERYDYRYKYPPNYPGPWDKLPQ